MSVQFQTSEQFDYSARGRLMLKNQLHTYGLIAIILHWLVALAVIGLFILGVWMTSLSYYDEWYKRGPDIHRAIGILLFFVILFRIFWRLTNITPTDEPGMTPAERSLAHAVHLLLYMLLIAMVISGYLISTADGRSIDVFGMFEVPALIQLDVENLEDKAGDVHWYLALALLSLAGLHALAALKHHFIDRDRTLIKMLGIKSRTGK